VTTTEDVASFVGLALDAMRTTGPRPLLPRVEMEAQLAGLQVSGAEDTILAELSGPVGDSSLAARLLVLKRIGPAGTSPPAIHLHRQADNGLFDRLAKDFDARWLEATPLTSREQLHAYLADTEHEPSPESDQLAERDPPSPRAPSQPSETPTASSGDAPRRWPGRRT